MQTHADYVIAPEVYYISAKLAASLGPVGLTVGGRRLVGLCWGGFTGQEMVVRIRHRALFILVKLIILCHVAGCLFLPSSPDESCFTCLQQ